MDMKLPSNTGEPAFWAEHEDFLRACEGRAYVKILVDDTTASGELERALRIVREVAPATPIFLQPVSGRDRPVEIGSTRLGQLFTLAKNHVSDVRVLPQTHRMIGIR
jgi:organic radical activating enzyme